MDRIEELVRESLQARAQDVEPTPALYQQVQRRVTRRQRWRIAVWTLAGATAAIAALVVVPTLLAADVTVPDIADAPVSGSSVNVPRHAVTVTDEGQIALLDLTDGTSDPYETVLPAGAIVALDGAPSERAPGVVLDALVRDGDAVSALRTGPAGGGGFREAADIIPSGGIVSSPDGRFVAYLTVPQEADGAVVTIEAVDSGEVSTVANVGADAALQDWYGDPDALSALVIRTSGSTLTQFGVEWTGERWQANDGAAEDTDVPMLAFSASHLSGGYGLEVHGDRSVVVAETGGQVDVTDLVGDADRAGLWLDAWGDGVLLGDGSSVWLLAHDGQGTFAEPRALPDGVVLAAAVGHDVEPSDEAEPDEEPAEPAPDPEPQPEPEATDLGALPGPVVVADGPTLRLIDADGARDLYTFPEEGHSVVQHVAVRPGSTSDDLTVAMTTTAEGFTDLRYLEIVGGDAGPPVLVDDPAHRPAAANDTDWRVDGLAWTPDGDSLAWVERDLGGNADLRTIGWDDGPGTGNTATDNASFDTAGVDDGGLVDIVDAGEGRLVLRFAGPDATGWWRWVLERQPDGALGIPQGSEPEFVQSPRPGATVPALGGSDDQSRPTWMLVFEFDGPVLLADPYGQARELPVPDDLPPDDGLPETWLHPLGDGVVIGGSGQGWYVDADGDATPLGQNVDGAVIR